MFAEPHWNTLSCLMLLNPCSVLWEIPLQAEGFCQKVACYRYNDANILTLSHKPNIAIPVYLSWGKIFWSHFLNEIQMLLKEQSFSFQDFLFKLKCISVEWSWVITTSSYNFKKHNLLRSSLLDKTIPFCLIFLNKQTII